MKERFRSATIILLTIVVLVLASTRLPADTSTCSGAMVTLPFTDVAGNIFFCQIAEAYFSGLTLGTTPTTYSPNDFVRRDQMAAFVTRTQDSALRRGSRKAALGMWGFPATPPNVSRTLLGDVPVAVKSDGADVWVAGQNGTLTRVQASDGKVLGVWTGATSARGLLAAWGHVYIGGLTNLYVIDPTVAPGPVTILSNTLGANPVDITTDGRYIWTANQSGSVSKVDPDTGLTTTFKSGFVQPFGIVFDGLSIWVSDPALGLAGLKRLDSNGNVIQDVDVGSGCAMPVFDGSNIWVPLTQGGVSVVRAKDGIVLAFLSGNGIQGPSHAAFDGQYVLLPNSSSTVSLWKAADLTPAGVVSFGVGTDTFAACSDGNNFWIALAGTKQLARL